MPGDGPESLWLHANGLPFHALASGPADGPLVLLLHGFPETSRSFRHQVPALAAAGHRAVAPDLRGYGRSGTRGPYDLATLAADVAGLVRALGRERATVIGHDWGGAVAWAAAALEGATVERLAVLNCPHPLTMAAELRRNPRQLRRSWYIGFFQLPLLPEWLLSRDRAAGVARALRGGAAIRDAFPPEELERAREVFSRPGALAGPLGYYRAAFRNALRPGAGPRFSPIAAPTLVVWGARDRFLGRETVAPEKVARRLAPGNVPEFAFLEDAGHFVHEEAPERVNAILGEWMGRTGTAGTGR
jgi:pimeloyl-ACP methyl ester carboxylesterase